MSSAPAPRKKKQQQHKKNLEISAFSAFFGTLFLIFLLVFLFLCFCHCGILEPVHPVRLVSFCCHHQVGTFLSQGSKIETSDPRISASAFIKLLHVFSPSSKKKRKHQQHKKNTEISPFSTFFSTLFLFFLLVFLFLCFCHCGICESVHPVCLVSFCCHHQLGNLGLRFLYFVWDMGPPWATLVITCGWRLSVSPGRDYTVRSHISCLMLLSFL